MRPNPTGFRHSSRTVAEARRLRNEDGLSIPKIVERLRKDHQLPSLCRETVQRWVNPAYADRQNANYNKRIYDRGKAWTFRLGGTAPTPQYCDALVLRLSQEDMSATAIEKACRVLLEDPPSLHEIRKLLKQGASE